MSTSNITGKKASKAPNDKSKYIPPGLLARGRGRQLRDVYTSNVQLENFAKSGFKFPIGASKKISCYDSMKRPNHLGSMKDYSVRVSTSFDAPFNPKSGSTVNLDDAVEHDNISSSESNHEDVAISSSENEDLQPLFDYNNMIINPNEEDFDPEVEEHENSIEKSTEPHQEENTTEDGNSKKRRRGRNKCKKIVKLKPGEKLPIEFYNNRSVGKNHKVFARHLGVIVRDTNMCPIKVHKWKDIAEKDKEHMWRAVTDVFYNENMETHREHVLEHMNELWTNWRADLLRYNVKKKKRTLQQAQNHVPNGLEKDEWKWLIKEIFSSDKFKKVSEQNSENRKGYKKELLHRTGSKPYRQVAWEMGAKDGAKPSILDMYRETHKKGNDLATSEIAMKCGEIQDIVEKEPNLSHWQVAEKVFKSKSRDRVVGCGGGVKLKDLRGPHSSRVELEAELNATKKENQALVNRVQTMEAKNQQLMTRLSSVESEMKKIKDVILHRFDLSTTETIVEEHI